ncbi:MAG: FKBP-type peptidyl-prolyl cis-trans isomerase [Bacteroidota bacterium]
MKKTNLSKLLVMIGVIFTIYACSEQPEYITTASGIQYKFVEDEEGDTLKLGEFMVANLEIRDDKDSVIISRLEESPALFKKDQLWLNASGRLEEVVNLCSSGDSVVIKMKAEDIFEPGGGTLPPNVQRGSILTVAMGVTDVLDNDGYRQWQNKLMEKNALERLALLSKDQLDANSKAQLEKDEQLIDAYLEENGITAEQDEYGLRYVITQEGEGETAKLTDVIKVNYHGKLLENGETFDQNNGIEFGLTQVVPGWQIGFQKLNPGTKATLYIPSGLAYGPRGAGGSIPPNAVLVFDVELLEIKN